VGSLYPSGVAVGSATSIVTLGIVWLAYDFAAPGRQCFHNKQALCQNWGWRGLAQQ
jgi:hypothetical protein